MTRATTLTQKVRTPFGSMYLHAEFDPLTGAVVGGSISTPHKDPDSQVAKLVDDLSGGLNDLLAALGRTEVPGG